MSIPVNKKHTHICIDCGKQFECDDNECESFDNCEDGLCSDCKTSRRRSMLDSEDALDWPELQ